MVLRPYMYSGSNLRDDFVHRGRDNEKMLERRFTRIVTALTATTTQARLRTKPGRCEQTVQLLENSQQPFQEMISRDDFLPPKAHRNIATTSFSGISAAPWYE